eukprot:CAMPEP_0198429124 /NCGR_PEP_ID=MMETSP1452-20131203/6984_1 /TAXON_ID=1181717 /ORGANISM="Synchroma pusillum, Strain CCMP3072" /LENGTH=613 /DNA_ID=CAMNT_0044149527 /DNA_START=9 /DNA_END=1847 /DNA_ORIENTATION=-
MSRGRVLRLYETMAMFENLDTGSCLVISQGVGGERHHRVCGSREEVALPADSGRANVIPIDAIYGIYELLSGCYVALVVESTPAVQWGDIEYRKVSKIAVLPLFKEGRHLSEEKQREEDRYLELLHSAFTSHQLFYSYTWDVTHSLQRVAKMNPQMRGRPMWARADERFFWNRDVVLDLIACQADEWITPIMSAYLDVRQRARLDDREFLLLFVSRRSRFRQGCRFTKRGLDEDGHVANFVETEQAVLLPDGQQMALVQVRGSIPLVWSSPSHLKWAPRVYISNDREASAKAALRHYDFLLNAYGDQQGDSSIVSICLVDSKRSQGELGTRFNEVLQAVQQKRPQRNLRYVWFDYHKELKKGMKTLTKLMSEVDDDLRAQGFFHKLHDGRVASWQKGALRTNCMDNLDRTNVVQSMFARRSLLLQLGKHEEARTGNVLQTPYKDFERMFRDVWANNADAMSTLYAGTPALKTDVTRTGKRTMKGRYNDGSNSLTRWYINNFLDGVRQDAIDLMLGRYKPADQAPEASPFRARKGFEPLPSFATKLFVVLVAIFSCLLLLSPEGVSLHGNLLVALSITAAAFLYLLFSAVKKGSKMGERLVVLPSLVSLHGNLL